MPDFWCSLAPNKMLAISGMLLMLVLHSVGAYSGFYTMPLRFASNTNEMKDEGLTFTGSVNRDTYTISNCPGDRDQEVHAVLDAISNAAQRAIDVMNDRGPIYSAYTAMFKSDDSRSIVRSLLSDLKFSECRA